MRTASYRTLLVTTVGAWAMGCALALAQAEAPLPAPKVDPQTLEEIQRQRAKFESPLSGSSFAPVDEQGQEDAEAFAEAYQRAAAECRLSMPLPADNVATFAAPDPRARYVTALRDAARLLDATAADLEDAEAFAEADELRTRAQKLRLDARQAQAECRVGNVEALPPVGVGHAE